MQGLPAPCSHLHWSYCTMVHAGEQWNGRESVEELKKVCLAFYDSKWKEREKKNKTASRITFTSAGGSIFILEDDPATIVAYLTNAYTKINHHTHCRVCRPYLALMPTHCQIPCWCGGSRMTGFNINTDGYKATTMLTKDHKWALSCQDQSSKPLYLDSGTTAHISPNQSNFISITLIPTRQICEVGVSIAAIGRTIHVHVAERTYINLKNALYMSKSTVWLLSISKITCEHGKSMMFDILKSP